MNAHLYDSDFDYYYDCLTPEQKLASDILDGDAPESLLKHFWECYELVSEYSVFRPMTEWEYAVEYSTDYLKQREEI